MYYIALGLVGFDHQMKAEAIAAAPLFQSHYKRIAMKNQEENWGNIEGHEGHYQVSDHGWVKSLKHGKERILTPGKSKGYLNVSLWNGVGKSYLIHRLVAIAFIPNPENKPEVNHKWGNKSDNRAIALEWATHAENILHTFRVLGRKQFKRNKKVNQYSKTGNYIQTFNSLTEASIITKRSKGNISDACRGRTKTSGGFIWKFK